MYVVALAVCAGSTRQRSANLSPSSFSPLGFQHKACSLRGWPCPRSTATIQSLSRSTPGMRRSCRPATPSTRLLSRSSFSSPELPPLPTPRR